MEKRKSFFLHNFSGLSVKVDEVVTLWAEEKRYECCCLLDWCSVACLDIGRFRRESCAKIISAIAISVRHADRNHGVCV